MFNNNNKTKKRSSNHGIPLPLYLCWLTVWTVCTETTVLAFSVGPSRVVRQTVLAAQQRRDFLQSGIQAAFGITVSSSLSIPVAASVAAEPTEADPLDAFGKKLTDAKWPESPSPLPSAFQSAAELTAPWEDELPNGKTSDSNAAADGNDLQQAMSDLNKKKRIGPLTHGT